MIRKLPAQERGRIANSPLQVGAQTCARFLAFREIRGNLPSDKCGRRFPATGRRGSFLKITAKRTVGCALANYLSGDKTCWRRTQPGKNLLRRNSLLTGKNTGNFGLELALVPGPRERILLILRKLRHRSPKRMREKQEFQDLIREPYSLIRLFWLADRHPNQIEV